MKLYNIEKQNFENQLKGSATILRHSDNILVWLLKKKPWIPHRENGPAVIYPSDRVYFYSNGKNIL